MIPQPRIHLRRDRTPNRKYIENNLYEIRKRLKQTENPKTNGVNKTIKSTEKGSSSSKKLTSSNGRANFKLAPADFITNLQRAHESFQRAQNQILDSNQNIVDQLKVPKNLEKDCISAQENDQIKLKMSSNVLSAVGLVPVANTSNSSKMHILEDDEEEGEEVCSLASEGGTTPSITTLKNGSGGGGGVLNGDLPETPPSDMDEEMKEEEMEVVGGENGDSVLVTNGKSSTLKNTAPKVKPSESGNSDKTTCDKIMEGDVEIGEDEEEKKKKKVNGREQHLDETEKATVLSSDHSNPTENKSSDTGTGIELTKPVANTRRRNSNEEISSGGDKQCTETEINQMAKDTKKNEDKNMKHEAKDIINNESSDIKDTDDKNSDSNSDRIERDSSDKNVLNNNNAINTNTDKMNKNIDDEKSSDKKQQKLHEKNNKKDDDDECVKETRNVDKQIPEETNCEISDENESKINKNMLGAEEKPEKEDQDGTAVEKNDKLTKSDVKEEGEESQDCDGDRQINKDTVGIRKTRKSNSSGDSKSCSVESTRKDVIEESSQNEDDERSEVASQQELALTANKSGERDKDLTSPGTAELNELMLANNMEITICKTSTPPPSGEKFTNLVNNTTTEPSLSGDLKRRRSSTSSNHSNSSSSSIRHHSSSKQHCSKLPNNSSSTEIEISTVTVVPSRPNSRSGNSTTTTNETSRNTSGELSRNSAIPPSESSRNSTTGGELSGNNVLLLATETLQSELSGNSTTSEHGGDSASEAESLVLEAASKAAASMEAELMLAKCTDGEVTITKSGAAATPTALPAVVGGGEQRSSVSDLRMMRRSDLKRTLSSDVRTNSTHNNNTNNNASSEGEGGGESEIEIKRAHLSGSGAEEGEEMMVTVQYEPDLTEPMECEEDDREKLVRHFVDSAMKPTADAVSMASKIKKEIHVLSELAHAKEIEWNSILRLKKLKEEMWERLNRKIRTEAMGYISKRRPSTSPSLPPSSTSQNKPPSSSSSIKSSPSPSPHSSRPFPSVSPNINVANLTVVPSSVSPSPSLKNQRLILPKPTAQLTAQSPLPSPNAEISLSESQGRQGRIKDVQTIIADYRSKNSANEGVQQTPVPKIRGRRSSTNSSRGSSHSSGSGSGSAGTPHQAGLEASRYSNPSLLSMANLALGSGATVRQPQQTAQSVVQQLQQQQQQQQAQQALEMNFLGNVQQGQRQGASQVKSQSMPLPPVVQPTFPEVTLHPVLPSPTQQQNSLLHGILTKTNNGKQVSTSSPQQQPPTIPGHLLPHPRSTSFSPTLARLLTAPERNRNGGGTTNSVGGAGGQHTGAQSFAASQNLTSMLRGQKMRQSGGGGNSGQPCSSDIVASLKQKIVPQQSRQQQQQQLHLQQAQQQQSEITITPVSNAQLHKTKEDSVVTLVEDEDETDRLIIDESPRQGAGGGGHSAQSASAGSQQQQQQAEQIPECQGCHRNSAQFVCAGCGNQWYCSRECQVTAWEEHSDVCSG